MVKGKGFWVLVVASLQSRFSRIILSYSSVVLITSIAITIAFVSICLTVAHVIFVSVSYISAPWSKTLCS